jgi:ribosomal protein L11 methylase PrmA
VTTGSYSSDILRDPGSFRDPDSGVLLAEDRVYRYFSAEAANDFNALADSGLLQSLVASGRVIESTPVQRGDASEAYAAAGENAELIVQHPRLPFISYPYEWPFEMLKAAALTQLDLTEELLKNGFMLKDATPYNFQFMGGRPLLIDAGSFERYEEGSPWMAYSQFCRTFLNPLLLQAFKGVPFQGWLRSSLEGIDPALLSGILPLRRKFRRAVFLDVVMQARLSKGQKPQEKPPTDDEDRAKQKPRKVHKEVIVGSIKRLRGAIEVLKRPGGGSTWLDYEAECPSYSAEAIEFKDRFVEQAAEDARPRIAWDLGANTGRYSEIIARHADYVVATDFDEPAVGAMYERVRDREDILPLVQDLLNPSPAQGWAHSERQSLEARGPADFATALALVHHLAIGGNVPLERFAAWLATVARAAVVEFVPKEDPMVKKLLQFRRDVFSDYSQAGFEAALGAHFEIKETVRIPDSHRLLYRVEAWPKSA